jgi:Tol biopolymer transport system component
MNDERELLEQAVRRFEPEPGLTERIYHRRDRKRRNQRITAGVVGIAVFVAAIWIVTSGLSLDRTETPAVPGPAEAIGPVPMTDYLLDLNTGEMTPLPETIVRSLGGRFGNQYAVSPDGSQLAYVGTGDQIFVAGIDGTGVRQVAHAPNGAGSLAWSPEGTRIAYEAFDSTRPARQVPDTLGGGMYRLHPLGLYVLDVASGESTQITSVNAVSGAFVGQYGELPLEPQFTPDGSSLVFTGGSSGHTVIRIVPVAGGESTLLIGPSWNVRDAENGSLSPDGSLVTFLGHEIGGPAPAPGSVVPERWVADTDGTDRRLLPDVYGIPCRSTPAGTWSPDGRRIVCSEASKVIVLDSATGAATPVAYGRGAIWLDDHTLLVSV